jgi:hypothetical protein
MTEKVVNVKELDKIKEAIDDVKEAIDDVIIKKSIPSTFNQLTVKIEGADLNEKDKRIFNYIKNNPGVIKTHVVKFFKNEKIPGYSRVPVFSAVKRLEQEYYMIIVEPDESNNKIHHLFINNENVLVSLIVDLDSFKHAYFDLIDKLDSLLSSEHIIFNGFIGLVENLKMVNALLTPFKFVLTLYIIFELFLPYEKVDDKELLHKKFKLIYDTIKDLQIKLHETTFKESRFRPSNSIYCDNFLHDRLGFLNNILHNGLWGSNYENIEEMLITFGKYELKDTAEVVLDCLWKIIYPIFPLLYPRYYKDNQEMFRDWRQVMISYRDFDETAQLSSYRKALTEITSMISKT